MTDKINCSFCDEEFFKSKIADHLIMCGNKTDQCPNCSKYVRRAVFAYHYENDCAADPDVATPENKRRQTTPPSERPRVSYKCEYCGFNCEKDDRHKHKENCVKNPKNQKKDKESFNDENANYQADDSKQSNDTDEDVGIPCEWCFKEIPFDRYEQHAEQCRDKEHRRLEAELEQRERNTASIPVKNGSAAASKPTRSATSGKSSVTIKTSAPTDTAVCVHCKETKSANGITYHQLVCVKNPKRNKNR